MLDALAISQKVIHAFKTDRLLIVGPIHIPSQDKQLVLLLLKNFLAKASNRCVGQSKRLCIHF